MPIFRIHREGIGTLLVSFLVFTLLLAFAVRVQPEVAPLVAIPGLLLLLFELAFFRHPRRTLAAVGERAIIAPADGQVVVVEETTDREFTAERCLQISIFMSLADVHVNRHPVSGVVVYRKYHPGKYLVAWHPKSSHENERASVVYRTRWGDLLLRQIAGALARRIITYPRVGEQVRQGDELGFIRFGSRVDLLLPPDAEVLVRPGQKVRANETVLARWH